MKIDDVLAVLHDGEWHSLQEIQKRCGLSERKMGIILGFLEKYGFVEAHPNTGRVRAEKMYIDFVRKMRWVDRVLV